MDLTQRSKLNRVTVHRVLQSLSAAQLVHQDRESRRYRVSVVWQTGMIAPPVGLNVFVISGMVKEVPMRDIYRGIMPFLAAMVVLLAILMGAPEIALYLPRTMR